jgi:carbon monoxide dehydrogenase subunit G
LFNVSIKNIKPKKSFEINGNGHGELGNGNGKAKISIINKNNKKYLSYSYGAKVDGKIMIVGNRLINASVKLLINQTFQSFVHKKRSNETILKKFLKILGINI